MSNNFSTETACCCIYVAQENENENTDDVAFRIMSGELDIEIDENDVNMTHRIGSRNREDGKPQAVIVKFTHYAV